MTAYRLVKVLVEEKNKYTTYMATPEFTKEIWEERQEFKRRVNEATSPGPMFPLVS